MRVMYERVAGIDVHKDMIKVGIRAPGHRAWTRTTEVLEFRTFYGVLQTMARDLRQRGVTHVVMEASGVYTEPVYYALARQDFEQVAVINPAHAKALKGHKTDAKDCAAAGGAVRVRAAARQLHPVAGAEGGAGPDPVPDEDGAGPHLGDPAAGQGAGIGRDQARLGGVRPDRQVGDADDRGADRRGAARAGAGGPGDRPDAHRGQAGRPVRWRWPAGSPITTRCCAGCTWTGSRCSTRRSPAWRPGSPSRPPPTSGSWTCSIGPRVRRRGGAGVAGRDRPGPASVLRQPREARLLGHACARATT